MLFGLNCGQYRRFGRRQCDFLARVVVLDSKIQAFVCKQNHRFSAAEFSQQRPAAFHNRDLPVQIVGVGSFSDASFRLNPDVHLLQHERGAE